MYLLGFTAFLIVVMIIGAYISNWNEKRQDEKVIKSRKEQYEITGVNLWGEDFRNK